MRSDEIDLRDEVLDMDDDSRQTPHRQILRFDADDAPLDIVPMQDEGSPSTSFDTVLRGYNKAQVEDYLDRVELALSEADTRHAEDGARFAAYDAEIASLNERLALAERRAARQPEPASLLTGRLAQMLALAEREAAEIRASAQDSADRILAEVKHRAEVDSQERTKALEAREAEVAAAEASVDKLRIEAQADAEQLREHTRTESTQRVTAARTEAEQLLADAKDEADALVQDAAQRAERLRTQADEDVRVAHEDARVRNAQEVEDAQARVDELRAQRDSVARELRSLTDKLNAIGASIGQISGS
jgi:DivIVA domain-containing protein